MTLLTDLYHQMQTRCFIIYNLHLVYQYFHFLFTKILGLFLHCFLSAALETGDYTISESIQKIPLGAQASLPAIQKRIFIILCEPMLMVTARVAHMLGKKFIAVRAYRTLDGKRKTLGWLIGERPGYRQTGKWKYYAVHVVLSEAKNLSRRRCPRGDSSLRSE